MAFDLRALEPDAIEDAVAYWLYPDEGWERWRLVPGSPVRSPDGRVLRLGFDLDGDRFELALVQQGERLSAKFDARDDPDREIPARAFESDGDVLVAFTEKDETVFVTLELAV